MNELVLVSTTTPIPSSGATNKPDANPERCRRGHHRMRAETVEEEGQSHLVWEAWSTANCGDNISRSVVAASTSPCWPTLPLRSHWAYRAMSFSGRQHRAGAEQGEVIVLHRTESSEHPMVAAGQRVRHAFTAYIVGVCHAERTQDMLPHVLGEGAPAMSSTSSPRTAKPWFAYAHFDPAGTSVRNTPPYSAAKSEAGACGGPAPHAARRVTSAIRGSSPIPAVWVSRCRNVTSARPTAARPGTPADTYLPGRRVRVAVRRAAATHRLQSASWRSTRCETRCRQRRTTISAGEPETLDGWPLTLCHDRDRDTPEPMTPCRLDRQRTDRGHPVNPLVVHGHDSP